MLLRGIQEEDFTNYKKIAMFLIFPWCTFKCDKEAGCAVCQNSELVTQVPTVAVDLDVIIQHYINNPLTHAIVCGGLEPLDSWEELQQLVIGLRKQTDDDIVIYTGYTEDECAEKIGWLSNYPNIVVKFGRFRYGQTSHYDTVLGISLASDNQYAKVIS